MSARHFLDTIKPFLADEEWFDAFMVACGVCPSPDRATCKLASQKLANLHRFGHLGRRRVWSTRGRVVYEYSFNTTKARTPSWVPAGLLA